MCVFVYACVCVYMCMFVVVFILRILLFVICYVTCHLCYAIVCAIFITVSHQQQLSSQESDEGRGSLLLTTY